MWREGKKTAQDQTYHLATIETNEIINNSGEDGERMASQKRFRWSDNKPRLHHHLPISTHPISWISQFNSIGERHGETIPFAQIPRRRDAIPIPESMTDQINLKSDLTSRKAVMRQQTITQSIHQSHADRSNTRRVGKMPTEEEVETGGAREAFRPLGTKEMNLRRATTARPKVNTIPKPSQYPPSPHTIHMMKSPYHVPEGGD